MSSRLTKASLFHRRLLLIAGGMVCVMTLLGAQLTRLSIVQGADRLELAEKALTQTTLLPTYRGTIYDRHGRKLAFDQPVYAIAVEYSVLSGRWARMMARRQVRSEYGRRRWDVLPPAAREQAIEDALPMWEGRIDALYERIAAISEVPRADLDVRRAEILERVDVLAEKVWSNQRAKLKKDYGADAVFTPEDLGEHRAAHLVVPNVSDEVAYAARRLAIEFEESVKALFPESRRRPPRVMSVKDTRQRAYPWASAMVLIDRSSFPGPLASPEPLRVQVDGVADHIIGSMRNARAEDVRRRPVWNQERHERDLGGYRIEGDVTGATGLERSFEDHLRGERGEIWVRLDTQETDRREPVPGADLELALDVRLQARVQALLGEEADLTRVRTYHHNDERIPIGRRLNSAAVVVEVATGDVLAMVSTPTIAMGDALDATDPDRALAWVNRPAEAFYPPGSIIKPLVFLAAHAEGVVRLDEEIRCDGKYFPGSERPRCWIYREKWDFQTHLDLDAAQALSQSCNIYFYTLADRLGMPILGDWFRRFGLGRRPGLGLWQRYEISPGEFVATGEHSGKVIKRPEIEKMDLNKRRFATVSMGIGQGAGVTWTPAQAANAYAAMARGGVWRPLSLVRQASSAEDEVDLGLDPRAIDVALRGLRGSLERGGTGAAITFESGEREPIINAPGVLAWGKTGTAQAPPLRRVDTNDDGKIDKDDNGLQGLDHAWFVGMVGDDADGAPEYVIAVIVEYGGSGGRVAGPIANQIIFALQDEEYLAPRPDETGETGS